MICEITNIQTSDRSPGVIYASLVETKTKRIFISAKLQSIIEMIHEQKLSVSNYHHWSSGGDN